MNRGKVVGQSVVATLQIVAVCFLSFHSAGELFARDRTPPVSFAANVGGDETIGEVVMPEVDVERYLEEDAERLAGGVIGPVRFAAPHFVDLDLLSSGTWEGLPGGGTIWRLRVVSPGALSLNFGFTTYRLPEGATLHLYAPDRKAFAGPYTGEHASEGELWTPVIPGDVAVIELFVPGDAAFEPTLVIGQVNHDYRGFGKMAVEELKVNQGWCNNDVICPEGDPWRDDIASEGVYTRSGYWTCSGEMMNSVADTPSPYFLTARHCGINTSNDQTVVIYWNYESPVCGWLCCGSLADNQSGSTWRASYSTSDFCLIELNQDPDSSSNVFYSGWDATGKVPTSCVAIHHPGTDEKAISFNNDPLQVTSYLGYSTPGNSSHLRVDDWEDGTTEGGSSGSGIWDSDHRLVGQLHGGYASCSSITSDWYGRLSVSWYGGGGASNSLKPWLDPGNTGTLVLDGRNPNDISTDLAEGRPAVIDRSGLLPISPNPTRGKSQIHFRLPEQGNVKLEVYSASGRLVSTVPAGSYPTGSWSVTWDGIASGSDLPMGIYFVRMLVNDEPAGTQKMVLVR